MIPISLLMNPLLGGLYVGLSVLVGFFCRKRVFGFWGFFLLSMFLTPIIIGLALVLAAPSPQQREKDRVRWLRNHGIR